MQALNVLKFDLFFYSHDDGTYASHIKPMGLVSAQSLFGTWKEIAFTNVTFRKSRLCLSHLAVIVLTPKKHQYDGDSGIETRELWVWEEFCASFPFSG